MSVPSLSRVSQEEVGDLIDSWDENTRRLLAWAFAVGMAHQARRVEDKLAIAETVNVGALKRFMAPPLTVTGRATTQLLDAVARTEIRERVWQEYEKGA